jgi:hypothetical protein
MLPIVAPLDPGRPSSEIANHQEALLLLIRSKRIRALKAPRKPTSTELRALTTCIREERARATFGPATRGRVRPLQRQQGLPRPSWQGYRVSMNSSFVSNISSVFDSVICDQ